MFFFFHPRKITSDRPSADLVAQATQQRQDARAVVLVAQPPAAPKPPVPPKD